MNTWHVPPLPSLLSLELYPGPSVDNLLHTRYLCTLTFLGTLSLYTCGVPLFLISLYWTSCNTSSNTLLSPSFNFPSWALLGI